MVKIIEYDETSGKHIAQCQCGIFIQGFLKTLKKKALCNTCAALARKKSPKELITNRVYQTYYRSAKKRKLKFKLTKPEVRAIIFLPCYFCKTSPASTQKDFKGFMYNGIDRLDPNIGYILSNCVSCCWVCNDMKGVLSVNEFLKKCQIITEFHHGNLNSFPELSGTDKTQN